MVRRAILRSLFLRESGFRQPVCRRAIAIAGVSQKSAS